jgi:hypothetical protein
MAAKIARVKADKSLSETEKAAMIKSIRQHAGKQTAEG